MAVNPQVLLSAIIPIAIVAPILAIRMRRMSKGTKVNTKRALIFTAILAAVAIVLVVNSFSMGISTYFIPIYVLIAGIAGIASYHYSSMSLYFWKTADGSISVKGGTSIFLLYVVSVIARLAISTIFGVGQGSFGASQDVTQTALTATKIFDGLLVAGAALMIGRNVRIITKNKMILEGKGSVNSEG